MTEEKIQAPAWVGAEQDRRREQEAALDQMRGWLEDEHREALEENSAAPFKFRLPIELLKDLPERDKEQLRSFERQTYTRLKSMAETKELRKRSYVASGGDGNRFEAQWALDGEEAELADKAAELERQARASSPYN